MYLCKILHFRVYHIFYVFTFDTIYPTMLKYQLICHIENVYKDPIYLFYTTRICPILLNINI